ECGRKHLDKMIRARVQFPEVGCEDNLVKPEPGVSEASQGKRTRDTDKKDGQGAARHKPDGESFWRDLPRPEHDDGDVGEQVENAQLLDHILGMEAGLYIMQMANLAVIEKGYVLVTPDHSDRYPVVAVVEVLPEQPAGPNELVARDAAFGDGVVVV